MQCNALADCCFCSTGEGRGAAPWRPSKARPPLPVWGADGYQMAGGKREGGVLFFLPIFLYLSPVYILLFHASPIFLPDCFIWKYTFSSSFWRMKRKVMQSTIKLYLGHIYHAGFFKVLCILRHKRWHCDSLMNMTHWSIVYFLSPLMTHALLKRPSLPFKRQTLSTQ